METRDRKKFWRVYSLFLLVATGGILLAGFWPHLFPSLYVSEVYKKYADDGHVAATFLRNFRVNDSVEVDVTLLEARDDEGWDILHKDFKIKPLPPEVESIINKESVNMWYAPRKNYKLPKDSIPINNDILVLSYGKRSLAIFSITENLQIEAIINHHISKTQTT